MGFKWRRKPLLPIFNSFVFFVKKNTKPLPDYYRFNFAQFLIFELKV